MSEFCNSLSLAVRSIAIFHEQSHWLILTEKGYISSSQDTCMSSILYHTATVLVQNIVWQHTHNILVLISYFKEVGVVGPCHINFFILAPGGHAQYLCTSQCDARSGKSWGFWWKTFLHPRNSDMTLLSNIDPWEFWQWIYNKSRHGPWGMQRILSFNFDSWWGFWHVFLC